MTVTTAPIASYQVLDEPELAFDPVDSLQRELNPLVGLARHGPFSSREWPSDAAGIRVALLAPAPDLQRLRDLLNDIWTPSHPAERRDYLPEYPGFKQAFRTTLGPADQAAQLPLDDRLDDLLADSPIPHRVLADSLIDSLRQLQVVRGLFNVIVFYLPPRWKRAFTAGDFDLHDEVKAHAAQLGLATQIVTDQAISYRCRASVGWRLGQALYTKAGGIPYKLATNAGLLDPQSAFVGIAYATRRSDDGSTSFTVCCSQVLDAAGGGMDFVAFDISGDVDPRNPLLSRPQMRTVLSASLSIYADRAVGTRPRRLVVHKLTPFTTEEIAGCADAWGGTHDLECLTLTRSPWRAAQATPGRPKPWGYAIDRGTLLPLDSYSRLLWVSGNAPKATLSGSTNYLQGGKGTPRPLLLTRWAGRGDLTQAAAEVLALTKIDWNNDALYDALPATVRYAQLLAGVVKHVPSLPPIPFDYRLFI